MPLLERVEEIGDGLGARAFNCSLDFAYCGQGSCSRHEVGGGDGVEVAACACESVRAGGDIGAVVQVFEASYQLVQLLAQSAAFVEILAAWANETSPSVDALEASVCQV